VVLVDYRLLAVLGIHDRQPAIGQAYVASWMHPNAFVVWTPMCDQLVHHGKPPCEVGHRAPLQIDDPCDATHGVRGS
jgi:hypothetical protein